MQGQILGPFRQELFLLTVTVFIDFLKVSCQLSLIFLVILHAITFLMLSIYIKYTEILLIPYVPQKGKIKAIFFLVMMSNR